VKRHIVLVGLPGSGKSTVGRMLAEQLQAPFVDVDAVIARKEGKPIIMIFAEQGEPAFRAMEQREVHAALDADASAVIAPGGGWAAQDGALASARGRAMVVYLKAKAETASKRAEPEGNRPTLLGEDPLGRMRTLLQDREPAYQLADATVETDRLTPEQVVAELVRLARTQGGW
jgi:shikimate kinase